MHPSSRHSAHCRSARLDAGRHVVVPSGITAATVVDLDPAAVVRSLTHGSGVEPLAANRALSDQPHPDRLRSPPELQPRQIAARADLTARRIPTVPDRLVAPLRHALVDQRAD